MAIENFAVNTLIIPMDTTYQNAGMFKAYGLVYDLLSNGIPVKWTIQSGKAFDGTDFTTNAIDLQTSAPIIGHNYTGGPFIIDSAFAAAALPIITAWQALYPNVKVHQATAPFSADVAATLTRAPIIAVENTNHGIMDAYLNIAAIPDSLGNPWSAASPGDLDGTEIAAGAFFGFDLSACRKIFYDIFLSPHTGDSTWTDPTLKFELNEYLRLGGYLHATCHSVPSIENIAGPFLTQAGIPTSDLNKGDSSTFTVDIPDHPVAQAVSTGLAQGLPGGSYQTVYTNTPGLIYNSETQILAHFVQNSTGKQYDFMHAGPYKNGTGAGKIVYEGGHNYNPSEPYSSNMENLYTRFVLDSVFFSVGKPLLYLQSSPAILFSGAVNTITFSVVNKGGSPAPNTGFSVTLVPGMTYNNDATIPPTSVVGQTLTWSSAALDTVQPGTVLTFTADFIPPAPVVTKLADFSTSFDDETGESYSLETCLTTQVEQLQVADVTAVKTVDKLFAQSGDILTYTVTITNNGPLPALNVVFTDPLPAGAIFANNVTINGVPAPGADPSLGIPLGIIPPPPPPANTVVVTWQVLVGDNIPIIDIVNQGFVDYDFVDPIFGQFHNQVPTNVVTTQVEKGELTLDKSVDKTAATVCDTLTYTVVVTNTGTVAANNVFFADTPPAGTSFVPGSVTVNGAPVPGDPGIPPGIPLGTIPVGGSVTVTFQVHVDFIPPPPPVPPIAANTASTSFTFRVNPAGPDLPGFATSNPAITQLLTPQLTLEKSADKAFADIGDTITYTVTVTNTGDVTANNVVFTDPIPAGTTFVPGSVTVAGAPVPGDPSVGIPLGNMAPGASVTVTFQVTATSLPVPNPTPNTANATGQFTIVPGEPPRTLGFDSNTVDVQIEEAKLDVIKTVDKPFVEVGDVVTYTVTINNPGTVDANNVVFTDNPPNGTTFIPGSATVNGLPVAGDPSLGIPVGTIPAGGSATVTFQVTIDAIPVPNPTVNIAGIDAEFTIVPGLPPVQKHFDSNPVDVRVEIAQLDVVKVVDKAFVEVGDLITYTVTVTNTGTVPANNVIFTDAAPFGTSFVPSSVTINGVPDGLANPETGINLGTIPAGGSVIVSFKVKADFVPDSNPAINTALIQATFPVDPNNPITKEFESNPVETTIEIARLDMTKSVDKPIVEVGDVVTYTVVVANTGTVPANNVIFTDTPPAGTTFVPGSVTVNGAPDLLANPSIGFNIGTIPAGGFTTVTFQVTVDTIPVPNPTINIAAATGTFPVNPNSPITKSFESNEVPLQVELAQLEVIKSADKPFAEIGEIVTFTVTINNTGTVIAQNVVFTDVPPSGTTFVPGSVTLNGVPVVGDPSAGIPIPNIPAGGTVTVTFQATVTSVPTPNPSTNIAIVNALFPVNPNLPPVAKEFPSNPVEEHVINAQVDVVKSVNKTGAVVGDTLTYTVTVTNTGNVDVDAVVFDLVPEGTVFVPNSLAIDGVLVPGANPNNGVALGVLTPAQSKTITFDVTIISRPEPPVLTNMATIEFQYIVNPAEPPRSKTQESNEVTTRVEIISMELVKTADKDKVVQGDILTYTIAVTNTGTLPVNNVIFKDPIPAGTSYVEGSLTVGGIPVPGANPGAGVNIGTINPGQTVLVKFSVRYDFLPCPPVIINIAFVEFNFRIEASGAIQTGEAESNETRTEAAQTNFKQLVVDETVCIPPQKPDAEDILNVLVDVEIITTRVIKTTKGTSQEGQILTGYKLLIEGMLHQKIEYIADEPTQSVHAAEFHVPFSSFIILPENFREGTIANVAAYVEDVYYKLISPRCIFKNITLRLEAENIC